MKAAQYGVRMRRYLKGTEDFGLKYLTKEETIKKLEEFSEDWPKEVLMNKEQRFGRIVHSQAKNHKSLKML